MPASTTSCIRAFLIALLLIGCSSPITLLDEDDQRDEPLPAPITNDEGGPVAINGEVSYTNAFFAIGTAAPLVVLEDQAGFVDRDAGYVLPVGSQTLGQITSDFYTSPFSYTIALPIEPQASLRDVDFDGESDLGVMVFAIAYRANVFGDPFLEERDLFGGGWSTAYASTRARGYAGAGGEFVGGTLLVYAPDASQGFPTGFGEDGRLFTPDDPIVVLPKGYTVVNMDDDPFTFDRSRYPTIDLIEPQTTALDDFSAYDYLAAFDALVDLLRRKYAFSDLKQVDWDALHRRFRPRVEAAQAAGDSLAFRRALRDFSFALPDGHVSGPFVVEDFRYSTGGGLGMAVRELDDGRVLASFIVDDGPADQAGIVVGAEIVAIDGLPIDIHVANTVALSGPFSTAHYERLQKLRYAVRFPLGAEVTVTYQNPTMQTPATASLTAVAENESFSHSSFNVGLDGFQLPLEFSRLENGHGYVKVYSFSDNELLTVQLWERLMHTLNDGSVPGLVVDMRQNGGGSSFLAHQLAAYFFDEALTLGNIGRYDEERGDFTFDPRTVDRFHVPSTDLRYGGAVAVLVGPNCNSACEFFVHDLTLQDRAAIIGHYPTAGLGGIIDVVRLPENIYFQYTAGRTVDMNGEVLIEGRGVAPTLRVPVDERTLFSDGDAVLDAAVRHLDRLTEIRFVEGGWLKLDGAVTGRLEPNMRIRYRLALQAGDVVDLYLEDGTGRLDTILRLYDPAGTLLASNDDAESRETANSAIEHFEMPIDLNLIVEVGAYGDDLTGEYILRADAGKKIAEPEPVLLLVPTPVVDASSDSNRVGAGSLGTQLPLRAEDVVGRAVTVRTEGARLSVRSGPGAEYPRIGYVPNESSHRVLAVSEDGAWLQIELSDNRNRGDGWVAAEFAELQ